MINSGLFTTVGGLIEGNGRFSNDTKELASLLNTSDVTLYIAVTDKNLILGTSINVKKQGTRPHVVIYLEEHPINFNSNSSLISRSTIFAYYQQCRNILQKNGYVLLSEDADFPLTQETVQTAPVLSVPDNLVNYTYGRLLVGKNITCISQNQASSIDYLIHLFNEMPKYLAVTTTALITKLGFGQANIVITDSRDVRWHVNFDAASIKETEDSSFYIQYYKQATELTQSDMRDAIKEKVLRLCEKSLGMSMKAKFYAHLSKEKITTSSISIHNTVAAADEESKKNAKKSGGLMTRIGIGKSKETVNFEDDLIVKVGNKTLAKNQYQYNPETGVLKIVNLLETGESMMETKSSYGDGGRYINPRNLDSYDLHSRSNTRYMPHSETERNKLKSSPSPDAANRQPVSSSTIGFLLLESVVDPILDVVEGAADNLNLKGTPFTYLSFYYYGGDTSRDNFIRGHIEIKKSPEPPYYSDDKSINVNELMIVGTQEDLDGGRNRIQQFINNAKDNRSIKHTSVMCIGQNENLPQYKVDMDSCTLEDFLSGIISTGKHPVQVQADVKQVNPQSMSMHSSQSMKVTIADITDRYKDELDCLKELDPIFSRVNEGRDFGKYYEDYCNYTLAVFNTLYGAKIINSDVTERICGGPRSPDAIGGVIYDVIKSINDPEFLDIKRIIYELLRLLSGYYLKLSNVKPSNVQASLNKYLKNEFLSSEEETLIRNYIDEANLSINLDKKTDNYSNVGGNRG